MPIPMEPMDSIALDVFHYPSTSHDREEYCKTPATPLSEASSQQLFYDELFTGGASPRFCTRLPPPVEVGRRPQGGGGGGGGGGGALEGGVQGGAMGGGGGREGQLGGGSTWGDLGWWGGGHRLPLPPLALPLG